MGWEIDRAIGRVALMSKLRVSRSRLTLRSVLTSVFTLSELTELNDLCLLFPVTTVEFRINGGNFTGL